MDSYSKTAMERAMKVQEVILRAMANKITWWQAGGSRLSLVHWKEYPTDVILMTRQRAF